MRCMTLPVVSFLALVVVSCAQTTTPTASSVPTPSLQPSAGPSLATVADLAPGRLQPGVQYVIPDLDGLSVQVEDDGWLAILPNGGDVVVTGGRTVVSITRPETIISADQTTRAPWPTDPAQARAALDAARGVTVEDATPMTLAGIETELLRVSTRGLGEAAPLLQSGSGEYGFVDGQAGVILLPVGDRLLFISIESSGDYERAMSEGQALLDGLSFGD